MKLKIEIDDVYNDLNKQINDSNFQNNDLKNK